MPGARQSVVFASAQVGVARNGTATIVTFGVSKSAITRSPLIKPPHRPSMAVLKNAIVLHVDRSKG